MPRCRLTVLLLLLAACSELPRDPAPTSPVPPPPAPTPGIVLAFTDLPSEILTGESFAVTVQALRGNDKALDFTGNVFLSLEGNGPATILSGITTVAAVGGVARFVDIRISGLATGLRLRATSIGATPGLSTTFTLAPLPQLKFVGTPSRLRTGEAFEVTVRAMRYY